MMPKVTLHHIALMVADLDAAIAFYRDALGIALEGAHDVDAEGVRVAFLPLHGDYANRPPAIELVQPTRLDTGVAKWMATHGQGMHHICVQVDDIDAAMKRASEHGATFTSAEPGRKSDGTRYVFIHPKTAFGALIELVQT